MIIVTIMWRNDEMGLMMRWGGCSQNDSELYMVFAENSQILLKISVILILLTFICLVSLNLLVNNQLNSSLQHIIVTYIFSQQTFKLSPGFQSVHAKFVTSTLKPIICSP